MRTYTKYNLDDDGNILNTVMESNYDDMSILYGYSTADKILEAGDSTDLISVLVKERPLRKAFNEMDSRDLLEFISTAKLYSREELEDMNYFSALCVPNDIKAAVIGEGYALILRESRESKLFTYSTPNELLNPAQIFDTLGISEFIYEYDGKSDTGWVSFYKIDHTMYLKEL